MANYDNEWRDFRKRRLVVIVAYIVLPSMGLVAFLNSKWLLEAPYWDLLAPAFAWLTFYVIAYERFERFLCPRCGNRFDRSWRIGRGIFARKCLHCGLAKFSNADWKS